MENRTNHVKTQCIFIQFKKNLLKIKKKMIVNHLHYSNSGLPGPYSAIHSVRVKPTPLPLGESMTT